MTSQHRAVLSRFLPDFLPRYFRHIGLVALLLIGWQSSLFAASHYIRAGASGSNNGNSWANAWPTFAAVNWIRGDTYYVAGGDYNETVIISRAASGTAWITLKKANAADNATDAGWNPSYATVQAVIHGPCYVYDPYIEIDGVTGSGTSGHGIKIVISGETPATVLKLATGAVPMHCYGVELAGPGYGSTYQGSDGFYSVNTSSVKGLRVARCWIHDVTRDGMTLTGFVGTNFDDYGYLVEDSVISETGGCLNVNNHGQGILAAYSANSAYCIIRNNVLRNNTGTAMIVLLETGTYHDFLIYNNLFHITDNTRYHLLSPGVFVGSQTAAGISKIQFLNNTIRNIKDTGAGITLAQCVIDTPGTTGNVLKNNIWENCYFSGTHRGFATQSNNAYFGNTGAGVPTGTTNQVSGSATTFVNPGAGDFRLLPQGYAVRRGLNLSSLFTTDFAGAARGEVWDIGAFKYVSVPPRAPAGVKISR